MAVRREYVSSLYRDILGREGSDQEIEGHLNNPGGEQGLYDLFNSVAGNQSDGRVNEATVGSQPQQQYQSQYDVQGAAPPVSNTMPVSNDPPPYAVLPPSQGANVAATGGAVPRTDQWSGPGTVAPGGNFGNLAGFDLTNFNDAGMQTAKYQNSRIFARYDPTKGAAQLMNDPEFKKLFPNARVVDVDKVDYGDGRPVDVIQNYGTPNAKWAWQTAEMQTPTSGGTARTGAGSSGSGSTVSNIRDIYSSLGQQYAGPGDAGITNGPLQQVGQDPLSLLISGALAKFLGDEGSTGFGREVQGALSEQLNRGGELDDAAVARRYESARELLDKGRRTMVNDLRGDLASRNLLSEPGIPQGAEIGGIERISENMAPEFSRALRDIYNDEAARADTRLMTSLQMATGLASDQARNLLAGIGEGTARQSALADIALRNLAQNQSWNMFLAQFGLERDKVMYELQNGQIDSLMPILEAFKLMAQLSNNGYV